MKTENDKELDYLHAVKTLTAQGYDLTDLFKQHETRLQAEFSKEITEMDLLFAITTPESWDAHFQPENVFDITVGGYKTLTLGNIRQGGQFKLSPAMRDVLRERYGLTPTETITVRELNLYPGSKVVKRLTLESNAHIADPKMRKHVLQACAITDFTRFMIAVKLSEEMRVKGDNADRKTTSADSPKSTQKVTKPSKSNTDLANEYL